MEPLFNRYLTDDEVIMWAAEDHWTIINAALLLLGLDPFNSDKIADAQDKERRIELRAKYNRLHDLITVITCNNKIESDLLYDSAFDDERKTPKVASLINFITSKGIPIDKRFVKAVLKDSTLPVESNDGEDKSNYEDDSVKYGFICINHYWDVVYEGKQTLVDDSLGMRYIGYLMLHKHKLIDWTTLYNSVKGVDPDLVDPGTSSEDVSEGFDLSQGNAGRIYAGKDKKKLQLEIEKREEKQEEEREFGNDDVVDVLQDQIDDIRKYISETFRKDGTLKEKAAETDNKKNAIKTAIRRAVYLVNR